MDREVTLMEILDARELRAKRQQQLLARYTLPLVSFTLNIAGPVKTSAAIRRAFREGCARLDDALRGTSIEIRAKQLFDAPTGPEGLYALCGEAAAIKALCIRLEDEDALGRLFDLDVLDADGRKLGRAQLRKPPRGCLICGKPGSGCASRRVQAQGLRAERAMLAATGGVNTHKGAIYSMGLLCAAAGRLWSADGICTDPEALLSECAALAREAAQKALADVRAETCRTAGERLWLRCGQRGVRGEAMEGFPSVRHLALPALEKALREGSSLERAGICALLHLMAGVQDTNLAARGGKRAQAFTAQYAARLLSRGDGTHAALVQFDREMIRRNLSPGGCADLLAMTYFLHFLQQDAAAI